MKLFALGLAAIALLPLPAIAKPSSDLLNAPTCYMITSRGRLINLNYMCAGTAKETITTSRATSNITASDICRAFASDVLTAQNQFQRDRANDGLKFCLQNKASIQNDIDNGN